MKVCSVPRCKSNSGSNVTFFSLPIIKYTRLRWLKFLLHFNKIVERHEKVLICDNHFDRGQIVTNCSRIRLVPGTVPSWGLALDGSLIQIEDKAKAFTFKEHKPANNNALRSKSHIVTRSRSKLSSASNRTTTETSGEPKVKEGNDFSGDQRPMNQSSMFIQEKPLDIKEEPSGTEQQPIKPENDFPSLQEGSSDDLLDVRQAMIKIDKQLKLHVDFLSQQDRSMENRLLVPVYKPRREPKVPQKPKIILCVICLGRFTSLLTFDMHKKLYHKNCLNLQPQTVLNLRLSPDTLEKHREMQNEFNC